MRRINKKQILTSGIVDRNGNQIPPSLIDWSEYAENPVLLYDAKEEGHGGVVVGRVEAIERRGDCWVGQLAFMERYEAADIAYEKYSQGVIPHVSIGGFAVGNKVNGEFVMAAYYPREHSLVKFPANREAKAIEASTLSVEDKQIVNNLSVKGSEIRYVTMSADVTLVNMKKTKAEQAAHDEKIERYVEAGEKVEPRASVEAVEAVEAKPEVLAVEASEAVEAVAYQAPVEAVEAVEGVPEILAVEASEGVEPVAYQAGVEAVEAVEAKPEVLAVEASEAVEAVAYQAPVEAVEAVEGVEGINDIEAAEINERISNPIPEGMAWHKKESSNNNKNQFGMKTFRELNCDADFKKRLQALNSALSAGSDRTDNVPENAETIKVLAEAMLNDKDVVIVASRTNYTNAVTQKKSNALEVLMNAAAGNATDATLAAADLGVITWLSLFYDKLLANDTFRRSLRFVPMSDKAGAIFIEDAVASPTYVGNNTPIAAPVYTYDDIKRTIARQVFSFEPILFQHSELAILAYDKQSRGLQSTMNQLMQDISTYWLQIIANTAGIGRAITTGDEVPSAGLFPIEAPNSDVGVLKPTLEDIIALEGQFLMQNYNFGEDGKRVEMVLPANTYSQLAGDPEVRSQLTRELNANIASMINFSATKITPRNPVARYNATSELMELDPSMYADKAVADDGTFSDIDPAVTIAANVGAGLAFVSDEVLAGVGTIELIASPSPQNYGTIISGWVSTGCTVARSNGVGAAAVIPGVVTAP